MPAAKKNVEKGEIRNTVLIADAAWCETQKRWPGLTVDQLLCRPKDALKVCNAVRQQFAGTPDEQICRALLNGRKQGRIKPAHRKSCMRIAQ